MRGGAALHYAPHAQPCIVGLHEQASQGCRHRRRTFVRWCRAPRKRGRGCARNDRGCVMGGVSKENGAKDCAVEAAAPLPTPELRGAEQQRVGLTLGAAQL